MHLLDLKNLISGPAADMQSVPMHLERSEELYTYGCSQRFRKSGRPPRTRRARTPRSPEG